MRFIYTNMYIYAYTHHLLNQVINLRVLSGHHPAVTRRHLLHATQATCVRFASKDPAMLKLINRALPNMPNQ